MPSVSLLNTTANLSGKTLAVCENTQTVTGAWTFDRDPSAPFVVSASSAVVTNLDADKVDGVDVGTLAANRIPYATSATALASAAGFTFDGTTFTMPGQIAFPAAQAASAGANVLDDYEEGTWTPVIGGAGGTSGQAYSRQVGTYVKIGQLVILGFDVRLSTEGTITGNAELQGLPFTIGGAANATFSGAPVWSDLATTWVQVLLQGVSGASVATIIGAAAAAAASTTALTATDIGNTTILMGTFVYRASA